MSDEGMYMHESAYNIEAKDLPSVNDTLKAISNVIELKPDKKYLFVFKGNITFDQLQSFIDVLTSQDIHSIGVSLDHGDDLQVIEAPKE